MSLTASSLTQLYNAYPKLRTCAFIGFVIDANTKIQVHWKQGKQNIANYPSKHHSKKHHISVLPTYVLNNIPKQTEILFKLPMTLQGCVQTHLPPTVQQLLDYKTPMPPVIVASVSNQRRQLTRHLSTFPKQTVQTRQLKTTALFELSTFQDKQILR